MGLGGGSEAETRSLLRWLGYLGRKVCWKKERQNDYTSQEQRRLCMSCQSMITQNTHWTNIILVEDSSLGAHTGPTSHWVEDSSMGAYTRPTSHWVEDSSMGAYTRPTSHWVEDSSMGTLDQHHTGLRIALWGHTLDQHHTGLRIALWGTHWTNITLG